MVPAPVLSKVRVVPEAPFKYSITCVSPDPGFKVSPPSKRLMYPLSPLPDARLIFPERI